MIDSMLKVNELESEVAVKLDLTEREQKLLEALQYMIDRHYRELRGRTPVQLSVLHKKGRKQ
jgi:hypothetical protein